MKRLYLFLGFLGVIAASISAAKVENIEVASASMRKTIKNVVVIPDSYQATSTYPVVYLLHGAGGNQNDWINMVPSIKELADTYQLLIVCPDGGVTSWYYDSPVDSSYKYETYVTSELLKHIDSNYSTINDKSGRAITGLSMGGHGGMYLSIRHQDVYGAGGSMSGGVDIRPFPNNWDIAKRLGTLADKSENWEKHTVVNLVPLLQGGSLKLIIDCGVDDFFYEVNKNLHKKLLEAKYPHDFIERPGAHNWQYWSNAVRYQMLYFSDFFKKIGVRRR